MLARHRAQGGNILALVAFAAGCAASSSSSGAGGSGGAASRASPDPSLPDGSGPTFGGQPSSPPQDGCSEAAKLVYVLSAERDLYSFRPDTLTFTRVGPLRCPAGVATPNSMAVDRAGTAWVNYSDGSLFRVSTADASCAATSFERDQLPGFARFGMAFRTNGEGSREEKLYVAGIDGIDVGRGLATIDLPTMKLERIGDFSSALRGESAELTGTGDGRLFGFFTTSPNATLARIDPASGATSEERRLDGVRTGVARAFSFWGGDFWFYTSNGFSPSSVTRLEASGDGSTRVVKNDVGGFMIVGAGVSTCAPTAPPR